MFRRARRIVAIGAAEGLALVLISGLAWEVTWKEARPNYTEPVFQPAL
jgi:hypothetical protein